MNWRIITEKEKKRFLEDENIGFYGSCPKNLSKHEMKKKTDNKVSPY